MIKYLGSKRLLLPVITEVIAALEPQGSVVDLFSGTSRVGHALKGLGYQVFANDLNAYAATLARCYVQADRDRLQARAEALIAELNGLPGEPGYFTETFCEASRFFQPKNGARVDAIREWIAANPMEEELEAILLVSLMEAADRVDSTTGVQMAYLKAWAPRAHRDLSLRLPELLPLAASGPGRASQLEAQTAAKTLRGNIGYLDPPYNQHKYLGNYHIWESLILWDKPEHYGIARKRVDCRERKSAFNSRPGICEAMTRVVLDLDVRHLVVSFSNEGHLSREAMVEILSKRGEVLVKEQDYRRYVGAKIGIYNPAGDKVGTVDHLENKEYLFVVSESCDRLERSRGQFRPAEEVL